jgi:hypothetical protein
MKAIKKKNQPETDFETKIHIELIIVIAKINFIYY